MLKLHYHYIQTEVQILKEMSGASIFYTENGGLLESAAWGCGEGRYNGGILEAFR